MGSNPFSIATADFNCDGNVDLATANNGDGTVSVLFGNGDGTFGPAQTLLLGGAPLGIAAADLNGDGLPDLAVANAGLEFGAALFSACGSFAAPVAYPVGSAPTAWR